MNPRRVSLFCYLGLIHYLLYSTYLIKSFSLKILLRVFSPIFNDDSVTDKHFIINLQQKRKNMVKNDSIVILLL